MTHAASPDRQSGFSLAETLVAMFILSILAVAGGNLLLRANDAGKQLREREAAIRELDIAQAFIRDDIAAMTARGWERPDAVGGPRTLTGGQTSLADGLISFVRTGWINPEGLSARSSLQTVRYTLSEEGDLVREAWLRPDPSSSTPKTQRTLLSDVAEVSLVFWRDGEASEYWEGTPEPPMNVLPDLIDMRITLNDGRVLTISARCAMVMS